MGGEALCFASRIGYNCIINVVYYGDFFGNCIAARTYFLFKTGCCASSIGNYFPITVGVTECVNVIVNVAVSANGAGVGCEALCITGRIGYNCIVLMSCGYNGIGVGVAAVCTGVGGVTVGGASGIGYNGIVVVTDCVNIGVNGAFTTNCTGMGGKALIGTGGFCNNRFVYVVAYKTDDFAIHSLNGGIVYLLNELEVIESGIGLLYGGPFAGFCIHSAGNNFNHNDECPVACFNCGNVAVFYSCFGESTNNCLPTVALISDSFKVFTISNA